MDMLQNFQDHAPETRSDKKMLTKQNHNPGPTQSTEVGSGEASFECSICFDLARDPVVTLCGHLYCWPCIFKWLHVQTSSTELTHQPSCAVCKARISQTSLIPLYCNGPSYTESNLSNPPRDSVPPRPAAYGLQALHTNQIPSDLQSRSPTFQHQQYFSDPYGSYSAITSSNLVSTTMAGIINPTIGLIGELVNPRMAGSTGTGMLTIPLPSSYAVVGRNNSRTRRQELQLDKSLNRVSIFLFCGLILCLLLF